MLTSQVNYLRKKSFDSGFFDISTEEFCNVVQNRVYRLIAYWETFGQKACVILAYVYDDGEIEQIRQETCLFEDRFATAHRLIEREIQRVN